MSYIPPDLHVLGNGNLHVRRTNRWEVFHESLAHDRVVVIHGPVGCGKTEGVRSYCRHHSLNCVEFDVTDPKSPEGFGRDLADTVNRSLSGRRWVLFLDDVEGILSYPQYAEPLTEFLARGPRRHASVVLACNSIYAKNLRPIKALVDAKRVASVCIEVPARSSCFAHFQTLGYAKSWIFEVTKHSGGDLRQARLLLEALAARKALRTAHGEIFVLGRELPTLVGGAIDRSESIFCALTNLVDEGSVDEWVRTSGDATQYVAFSNYPALVESTPEWSSRAQGPDALADVADALSRADVARCSQLPFGDEMVARALQSNVEPSDLPMRSRRYTLDKHLRSTGPRVDFDVPRALGGVRID